jgi:hypothetical protein
MNRPIIRIHDLETDTITDRELNDEELAKYEKEQAVIAETQAAAEAKEAAKAAAEAKLEALGLTTDDLRALGL